MNREEGKTKYIILVGDGMADYPIEALGGKTPLEAADTPNMDRIAACRVGLVQTIPAGMEPGSDIANLALLGYEPHAYPKGRAPLEAASLGVQLGPDQVAFRMNLVTLDRKNNDEMIMVSHSSGDISTPEATEIVETLKQEILFPGIAIHQGVAFRHLLVWDNGPEDDRTIPPHDVLEQNMAPYLNQAPDDPLVRLIRNSWKILADHSINRARRQAGLNEANSIWLWGQGKAPKLTPFREVYGLRGGVISAVDLINGIGVYAGFTPIHVEGATGFLDTNYLGKAEEGLKGLENLDFLYLHVEAPDEAGHAGNYEEKIQAIENFDEKVVGTVLEGLERFEDYRVMVVSDHFTPIIRRTHTLEPPPFAWASKGELRAPGKGLSFSEEAAKESGLLFEKGHELMNHFIYGP
ncbi:cofactor-independent phosphoglycerate mutase [Thermodesulfobacteriota bacterium]